MKYIIELGDRANSPESPYSAAMYEDRGGGKTGDVIECGVGATPAEALRDLANDIERHGA